jgi:hypothetical protein
LEKRGRHRQNIAICLKTVPPIKKRREEVASWNFHVTDLLVVKTEENLFPWGGKVKVPSGVAGMKK